MYSMLQLSDEEIDTISLQFRYFKVSNDNERPNIVSSEAAQQFITFWQQWELFLYTLATSAKKTTGSATLKC